MTKPLEPTVLEEDGQQFNIAASPYLVVRGSFFPVCAEDSPQVPVIDYPQVSGRTAA